MGLSLGLYEGGLGSNRHKQEHSNSPDHAEVADRALENSDERQTEQSILNARAQLRQKLLEVVIGEEGDEGDENGLSPVRITVREDSSYYYYDVQGEGLRTEDFHVRAENGQVTISGEIASQGALQKFERTFSVPEDSDPAKLEVRPGADPGTLVVRISKAR